MIDQAAVRQITLRAATEDYCGLYELLWELNAKYPEAGTAEKLAVARAALGALFAEGLVDLFSAGWLPREYHPVLMAEGSTLLAGDASWRAPSEATEGTFFAFAVTEAGKRAWEHTKLLAAAPFRSTGEDRSFSTMDDVQLVAALTQGRFREANELTARLLKTAPLPASFIGRIADVWSRHTDDLQGLGIQARAWNRLGGPAATGRNRWELFRHLGDLIGWRERGFWISLPGTDSPGGSFPVFEIDGDPRRFPLGCLPFHNVLAEDSWHSGFSPRDCWGEHVWDRWSDVYRLVLQATDGSGGTSK